MRPARPANYAQLAKAARAKATQGHVPEHLLPSGPQASTKLQKLRDAFAQGDYKGAMAIAAKFPNLGQERDAILAAHTAYQNPGWAKSLGRDVAKDVGAGVQALCTKYGL